MSDNDSDRDGEEEDDVSNNDLEILGEQSGTADSTCAASGGTEALVKKDSQVLGNLSRASLRGRSGREWGQERRGFRNRCPVRFWVIMSLLVTLVEENGDKSGLFF